MTSYVNSYVEKTNLLRALLGDVRNQPIKRLMADVIYIYNLEFVQPYTTIYEYYKMSMFFASSPAVSSLSHIVAPTINRNLHHIRTQLNPMVLQAVR